MPKLKSHRGACKRFRKTASGAIKRRGAYRNHILFRAVQHRLEVFMILAGECLRGEDHLMFGIDQRLGIVSLNDPVRGRHLDRFVIHRIALDLFAVAAALGLAIL